jgi:hypothetical protein
MTATPEVWDDVGGLRLQVDCMSQKVDEVEKGLAAFHGLTDSQLQKLKDEILLIHADGQREQNKERCQMKVCIIIISVLLGCALARLAWVDYRHWGEAQKTSNDELTLWNVVGKKEPEAKRTGRLRMRLYSQTPEAEGCTRKAAPMRKDDQVAMLNSVDGNVEVKSARKSSKGTQPLPMIAPPLPVPILSNISLPQFSRGVFYVCLPAKNFEQSLKTYASVFTEVLHSQKWGLYPFCYVDTRIPKKGKDDDLCEDNAKITFVMEKSSTGESLDEKHVSRPHIPSHAKFESCVDIFWRDEELFKIESPAFFRRTFRPEKVIQVSAIEEFFNGVYSGKIPEVVFPKRDL